MPRVSEPLDAIEARFAQIEKSAHALLQGKDSVTVTKKILAVCCRAYVNFGLGSFDLPKESKVHGQDLQCVENALHEICHAYLLRVPLGENLTDRVEQRISEMTSHEADWNELKTCAMELVLLKKLGIQLCLDDLVTPQAFDRCPSESVQPRVKRLLRCKVTHARAQSVWRLLSTLEV